MTRRVVIDFETHPIETGSPKSPQPVGVAIYLPGGTPYYMSWGHPMGNNCTESEARQRLTELAQKYRFVMHNAQFDLRVMWEHMSVSTTCHGFDDTKLAMYLVNPSHPTLSLKPLAEELLGMAPEERDEMHAWLRSNYLPARRTPNPTKYTAYAPGGLAGTYAIGDVVRTWGLWQHASKMDARTREAYARELKVIPLCIDMESFGVRIDRSALRRDLKRVEARLEATESRLRARLGDINFGSRPQLADALEDIDAVDGWLFTPKGSRKVSVEALREVCKDRELVDGLELRSKMMKLLGTYMRPWSQGERFYPYFNPIRREESGGTRTGRFSSNFQQIPKEPFGDLPHMRRYVRPDVGHVLVWRDYSQQELRILAHYEHGDLARGFQQNPAMDVHDYVGGLITARTGQAIDRKSVKICNFLTIYGGGAPRLADQLGVEVEVARRIKRAHAAALPGVRVLMDDLEATYNNIGYLRTWGGRKYKLEKGFEYKALNYLIQGSAADQTKEAMTRYDGPGRIVMQVHDEIVLSVPRGEAKDGAEALRIAMEDIDGWDVPMRSDLSRGVRWQ